MYDIGLTLHEIVLDSLEPIVVKNLLNSFAINSLSVTVLPLMQKLILRDVLLIPLPMMVYGFSRIVLYRLYSVPIVYYNTKSQHSSSQR